METLILSNGRYSEETRGSDSFESNNSSPNENFSSGTSEYYLDMDQGNYNIFESANFEDESLYNECFDNISSLLQNPVNANSEHSQSSSGTNYNSDNWDYNLFGETSQNDNEVYTSNSEESERSYQLVIPENLTEELVAGMGGNLSEDNNVDRKVDIQLKPSDDVINIIDHIEEVFPSMDFFQSLLGPGVIDVYEKMVESDSAANDQMYIDNIPLDQEIKPDLNLHPVQPKAEFSQYIEPKVEYLPQEPKVENDVKEIKVENYLQGPKVPVCRKKLDVKVEFNSISECDSPRHKVTQNIPFKPRHVAGRKRIDMKLQKYILDDEDDDDKEEIDIETVTKEDNPVIEAGDVNSLLEQFEMADINKGRKSKKDKISSNTMNSSKSLKHKTETVVVTKHEESSRSSRDERKRKRSETSDKTDKHNNKDDSRREESTKHRSKASSSKSNDKKSSPKSSHHSHTKKPEEQRKDEKHRERHNSQSTKSHKRDKHTSHENKTVNQTKPETVKTNPKSPPSDVPKDLIGRIKEANKPRTVVLLDDVNFLGGDPVYNKKKVKKPKTSPKSIPKSEVAGSSRGKSVSTGTSSEGWNFKPYANGLDQAKPFSEASSKFSTNVTSSKPEPNGLLPKKSMVQSAPSRLTIVPPQKNGWTKNGSIATPSKSTTTKGLTPPRIAKSDAFTHTGSQQIKPIKPWYISLDHSYHKSDLQNEGLEEGEILLNETSKHFKNKSLNQVRAHSNNTAEKPVIEKPKEQTGAPETKKPTKQVWNLEKYMKIRGIPTPKINNNSTEISHEQWVKKMALDTTPAPTNIALNTLPVPMKIALGTASKPEKIAQFTVPVPQKMTLDTRPVPKKMALDTVPAPTNIPLHNSPPAIPPVPKGLEVLETIEASVDACLADETAMNNYEKTKQRLLKEKHTVCNNALISVYKELPNKPEDPRKERVVRSNKCREYYQKDRVKPEMCSAGTQTDMSFLPAVPINLDSSNSDDDSSSSRKRSRSVRDSSPSRSHYYSPSEHSFRTEEEREEFKRDAMNRCILFLGEVPDYMDEDSLYKLFRIYGHIKEIKHYHRGAKRMRTESGVVESNNYAFITFTESNSAFSALTYYRRDYPNGAPFQMSFGGRREFCNQQYTDLDNMPRNFQYDCEMRRRKHSEDFQNMLKDTEKKIIKKKQRQLKKSPSS